MAIPSYRDGFDFDIFVVYNEADEAWCLDELVPQMKSAGLRVCTPEDGIIGRPIHDNFDQLAYRSQAVAGILALWELRGLTRKSDDDLVDRARYGEKE